MYYLVKSVYRCSLIIYYISVVANDFNWLTHTLSKTSQNDAFTSKLMDIYKEVMSVGIKQPISIGTKLLNFQFYSYYSIIIIIKMSLLI